MSLNIAYTKNGPILGDFTDIGNSYTVTNPVMVRIEPQTVGFFPFLGICEETDISLVKEDINYGKLFTPVIELRNQYNTLFGGPGLEIVTSPKIQVR